MIANPCVDMLVAREREPERIGRIIKVRTQGRVDVWWIGEGISLLLQTKHLIEVQ